MIDLTDLYDSTTTAATDLHKSRQTGIRWCNQHPGLAVVIGGRTHPPKSAMQLVAQGTPLAEAARRGEAG